MGEAAPAPAEGWRARWKEETRVMLHIALPIVLSNLLAVGMQLTDIGFVGRIGKTELGAAALGNTVFYLLHYPMLGVMTAIDTLLATTFGAGHMRAYGDWTVTSLVVVTALTVPVMALMMVVEPMLKGIEQDDELSALAGSFCVQLVWGIPPYYWFQVYTKYLQSQHILAPPVYMGIVANVFNVILNWILIFGPANMGFRGAPIATSACRWFQLLLALAYAGFWRTRDASTRPRRWLMRRDKLLKLTRGFWKLAGPGAVMLLIEAWSFEITTLLAGYLGTVALDAHLTMLQLATLAFLSLPFAVAIASTIRIGNLLGAGDALRAKDAMYVTFFICFAFMAVCGVVFAAAADHLGRVFTNDREVIEATAKIAYIAALFQLVDGGQAAAGGVFRGMGRQVTVAVRNLLGFWVFGIPSGCVLTFALGVGLAGLWWGLTVGLTITTIISVVELVKVDWAREVVKAEERAAAGDEEAKIADLALDGEEPDEVDNNAVVVEVAK